MYDIHQIQKSAKLFSGVRNQIVGTFLERKKNKVKVWELVNDAKSIPSLDPDGVLWLKFFELYNHDVCLCLYITYFQKKIIKIWNYEVFGILNLRGI